MRQRVGTGAFSAAIRIVGEEGAPGEDGQYTSYEFAKNNSLTVAPTIGFTDEPPTINTNEFLWMRTGKFDSSGQIGSWSNPVRISGPQGVPGVDGPPGADGQSLYTWVKYADTAAGAGLSDSPTGKDYIGTAYNKTTPSESNVPADYTFAKYRGDQGIPGGIGPNGESLYTWIKYADTPTTGMSDLPEGKDYFEGFTNGAIVGFQAVNTTGQLMMALNEDPDTDTSFGSLDYAIFLDNGGNGLYYVFQSGVNVSGSLGGYGPGDKFSVQYDEFRFQKNGSTTVPPTVTNVAAPSGWTIEQPATGIGEYLWMISALKSGVTNALINNWSTPVRTSSKDGNDGAPGAPGAAGAPGSAGPVGPFLNYTGNYNETNGVAVPNKQYTGSSNILQAVKYNGSYYVTRIDAGTFSGVLPTDPSKWNVFGAQLDSIATGLILAQAATIENLTVRNVKTSDSGRRLEIIGADNRMTYYGLVTGTGTEYEALRIADNIDTQATGQATGGIKV
nr:hypothetical protein [Tanacetum cinerariifolium]